MPKIVIGFALALCLATTYPLQAACSDTLAARYKQVDTLVQSLHVDKPGQMRVFARDGSEYTGGQVLWMQGRLRHAQRLCASGSAQDQGRAAQIIGEVEDLVRSHARSL